CDRPKQPRMSLRASVGSAEAILPERPRTLSCALLGACWAPHLAPFLASHEGDRAASFKNRHPMVGEPDSSGSMSAPVRSEIQVGPPLQSGGRVPDRSLGPRGMVSRGKRRPYLGELVEVDGNGDHRRRSHDTGVDPTGAEIQSPMSIGRLW